MTVTLDLTADHERQLRQRAAESGQTVEAYLEQLVVRETTAAGGTTSASDSEPPRSLEEFDRLLDELSEGMPPVPPLPADFSRADIYADHD